MANKTILIAAAVVLVGLAIVAAALLIRATTVPSTAPCVNRLRLIDSAKQQWALEFSKPTNAVPSWNDILGYLPSDWTNRWWSNGMAVCPEGGTYTLGRVGDPPKCSIGGQRHSLSQ
jgi:hypothetical protein